MKTLLHQLILLFAWFMPIKFVETQQTTDTILMISPDTFQFNSETASTNAFQHSVTDKNMQTSAQLEFAKMVATLQKNNIRVIVIPSRKNVITPDAVFPNNWLSTHVNEKHATTMIIYPMLTKNRRLEKQTKAVITALEKNNIVVSNVIDLSFFEKNTQALEGTGSMVFDRINRIAYAAISPRTDFNLLKKFTRKYHYKLIAFHSYDENKQLVYHTNVMMNIGTKFAVIALESITDLNERQKVVAALQKTNRKIIPISQQQMQKMAGNILEVHNAHAENFIILSTSAYQAFTEAERHELANFAKLLPVNIPTIEKIAGGSARCMMAEIFYAA